MADELDLLKQQFEILRKEIDLLKQGEAIEFDKISKAFNQIGSLIDLLYLETNCLIEILAKKNIFTKEEFTALLEDTAKKVEEAIKASTDAAEKKEQSSIIV